MVVHARDRRQRPPLSFRLPEADEDWLREHARLTGQPVGAVLRAALRAYRASARRPTKLDRLRAARAASNRGRTT